MSGESVIGPGRNNDDGVKRLKLVISEVGYAEILSGRSLKIRISEPLLSIEVVGIRGRLADHDLMNWHDI